jgi:hypothetical protein
MLRTRKWEEFLINVEVVSGDPVVVWALWDKALVLVRVLISWCVFAMSLTRA